MPRDGDRRAAHAEREQRKVDLRWQGDAIVGSRELQRALGQGAWRVWTALLGLRNEAGETHVTTASLQKMAQLNAAGIKRALRRLRAARLVKDTGKLYTLVPCTRCTPEDTYHHHEVYLRHVFGQLMAGDTALERPRARVPAATAKWAAGAPGWGGKRKGAGRPEGLVETGPRKPRTRRIKMYPEDSRCTPYKNQREEPEEAKASSSSSPPRSRRVISSKVGTALTPVQAAVLEAAGKRRRPLPAKSSAEEAVVVAGDFAQTREPVEPVWQEPEAGGELVLRGGGQNRQTITSEDAEVLYVLERQLPMLDVPAPPKLSDKDSDDERIGKLVRGWQAAHEKVTGRRWWDAKRGKLSEPQRKKMLACAEALQAASLSPATWALFSFRLWRGPMGKSGVPAQGWLWSAARVQQHARWCRDDVGSYVRGRPIWTPASRELLSVIGRLRSLIGRGRDPHVVLDELMPKARREELVARAKVELEEARQDVQQRIQQGEWVWG